ncbi:MAG: protein kinase domain-containing protein [Acidimicrobiia bacterium]
MNERVDDRFEVQEPLGSGGMSTVWRARDAALDRSVAIKRLHAHLAADRAAAARFQQEARAAGSLSHPGVVAVYDAGEDQGGPFIVMEYVDGESLADLLKREGRLPPERATEVAAAVAEALHFGHERGVVHRDVKPSNVLLDPDGRVRVADFGIARTLDGSARLTAEGMVMGTASYVAPEVAMGKAATPASDTYSLGILLYEMLIGRTPFEGETPMSVLMAHQTEEPVPPGRLAELPSGLEQVVLRALAKDPAERYPSAAEMAEALRSPGEMDATRAMAAVPAGGTTVPLPAAERPDTPPASWPERRERLAGWWPGWPEVAAWWRAHPQLLVVVLAVAGIVLAGLLLSALGSSDQPTESSVTVSSAPPTTVAPTVPPEEEGPPGDVGPPGNRGQGRGRP